MRETQLVHLVIIGNTGSGKTTVAKELEIRMNLPRISTGDIARAMAQSDPSTHLALQQGAMAPEAAMRTEVRNRLEEADSQRGGWILDGFPRTTEQLICLMQWTTALPMFVRLEAYPWACIERLVARGREDDNPDAVTRRLESFEQKTRPMLRILEPIIHNVDALHNIDDVTRRIERLLTGEPTQ